MAKMEIDSDTAHSLTRLLMATAFMIAAILCFQSRNRGVAFFFFLSTIETYAKLRYPFHSWARDFLLTFVPDELSKTDVQNVLMIVLVTIILLGVIFLPSRLARYGPARSKIYLGACTTLILLCVEMVSIHSVDTFLYAIDGPFVRCGWAYACAAVLSAIGARQITKNRMKPVSRPSR